MFGIVIVCFNSEDVIADCLNSIAQAAVKLEENITVFLVDNGSTDNTLVLVHKIIKYLNEIERRAESKSSVLKLDFVVERSNINGGFAFGVNLGLEALFRKYACERVLVLNPDTLLDVDCLSKFQMYNPGPFSIMGGRVLYHDKPEMIQIDGGIIDRRSGVTHNVNLFQNADTLGPKAETLDFITGASMVVSRAFYDAVGPMREEYFLYYEEVDWALRRGDLPLAYCPGAIVYHRAGTAIGSPTLGRPASPFSLYFKHRARLRFMRAHFPRSVPTALAYSFAKAAQLVLKGYLTEAWTILSASFGRPPSVAIKARLGPEATALLAKLDARQG